MNIVDGKITCGHCSGLCGMHCSAVAVFARHEDEADGLHVFIKCVDDANERRRPSVSVDNDIHNNPSDRREAICLHLWCEQCGSKSVVEIVQHKGQLLVSEDVIPT